MPESRDGELPRRAFLGAHLAPDSECFSGAGMKILGTEPGSMAEEAQLEPGDEIVRLASCPLGSLCDLGVALRIAGASERVLVEFLREERMQTADVAVRHYPRESIEGSRVHYDFIDVSGARLRTITTLPTDAPPKAAILLVQGIACESVDYGTSPDEPFAQLVRGWANAGCMTMRVDKRGVGDSEGCVCPENDFETEERDFRFALEALAHDSRRQGAPIMLFGHSVGGMIAPQLAAELPVRSIMVYGTSTANWLDCVMASTERQLRLRKVSDEAIATHLRDLRDRVLASGLNGRSANYHRQLDAIDLGARWERVKETPTQILCGEHDWVLSREEQVSIAGIVEQSEIVDLPGLDHMLGYHVDRESSLGAYGQGEFRPEVLERTLEWIVAHP